MDHLSKILTTFISPRQTTNIEKTIFLAFHYYGISIFWILSGYFLL